MAGKLSTHVLDTYHGCPAASLTVELWAYESGQPAKMLKRIVTNGDGRSEGPLLTGEELSAGTFELRFQVGAYFRRMATPIPEPLFLDEVPVRFTVADPAANYHVPLLVSPWAYSTYRGS
jgi:5-hydroxyisourate hydrolase